MAKTPEARIKDAVKKILTKHGVYFFFPATGGFGRSGVPDIICCVKGLFLAIECKAEFKTPTALQAREIQKIRDAGGAALTINQSTIGVLEPLIAALANDSSFSGRA